MTSGINQLSSEQKMRECWVRSFIMHGQISFWRI